MATCNCPAPITEDGEFFLFCMSDDGHKDLCSSIAFEPCWFCGGFNSHDEVCPIDDLSMSPMYIKWDGQGVWRINFSTAPDKPFG